MTISNGGTPVQPISVTFLANTAAYTIQGTDGIGGTAFVLLNGSGTVNMNTVNSYDGGTTLNAGLLNIGNASALGVPDNNPGPGTLTLNGGTFDNTQRQAQ